MADLELSLVQFENIMQKLIGSILGWDDDTISKNVRISWPTSTAPAFGIHDDVVFIQCFEYDNPIINRLREVVYTEISSPAEFNMETGFTRVWDLQLVLYGDNSFENAHTIEHQIYYPDIKYILAQSNLYLVPDIGPLKRIPEYFEGQWWKRADMSMQFNELILINSTVPIIESIEVTVDDSDGNEIADVKIQ